MSIFSLGIYLLCNAAIGSEQEFYSTNAQKHRFAAAAGDAYCVSIIEVGDFEGSSPAGFG
jgi:hypothetical protein